MNQALGKTGQTGLKPGPVFPPDLRKPFRKLISGTASNKQFRGAKSSKFIIPV
jgi:hypothetical protein